jgi:hypothetical protein
MSHVGAFIPRLRFRRRTQVLLLFFAVIYLLCDQPAWTQANSAPDPQSFEPKCRAWRQKALSGQWFTQSEGDDFEQTEKIEDKLRSIPACRDFFALQKSCQETWVAPDIAATVQGSRAAERRAMAALLNSIESNSGCKSIFGLEAICEVLRRTPNLSPRLRSILSQCADQSVVDSVSGMLRPAL